MTETIYVSGNCTADLDSVVSALVLANISPFLSSKFFERTQYILLAKLLHKNRIVGYIKKTRSAFKNSFAHFYLGSVCRNIFDNVVFADDVLLSNIESIIQVDYYNCEENPKYVIDHHQQPVKELFEPNKYVSFPRASCTSLVADIVLDFLQHGILHIDEYICLNLNFLATCILFDSRSFEPTSRNIIWTSEDLNNYRYLSSIISIYSKLNIKCSNVFNDYETWKNDVLVKMDITGLLCYDTKDYRFNDDLITFASLPFDFNSEQLTDLSDFFKGLVICRNKQATILYCCSVSQQTADEIVVMINNSKWEFSKTRLLKNIYKFELPQGITRKILVSKLNYKCS